MRITTFTKKVNRKKLSALCTAIGIAYIIISIIAMGDDHNTCHVFYYTSQGISGTSDHGFSIPKQGQNINASEYYTYMCNNMSIWQNRSEKGLCTCQPKHLIGSIDVDKSSPSMESVRLDNPEVKPGGKWEPSSCTSRQKVAIIIPFRDRKSHLRTLLKYLHPMLQRQHIHYQIFVVEQAGNGIFNKGVVMNAGFIEAMNMQDFDCLIFHDVDLIPEDDRNLYMCNTFIRHMTPFIERYNYSLPYCRIFGGAVSFTPAQFMLVNGFSVDYYGWGGEDDDLLNRLEAKNLYFIRYPKDICRYRNIEHDRDKLNPGNSSDKRKLVAREMGQFDKNGLNNLQYQLEHTQLLPLYTLVLVEVPPEPTKLEENSILP